MIRKDTIYLIVIVGLLIWIVVQTCSPPPEPVEDTTYKDSVKVLKSQKAVISSRMKAIHEASILRQEMDSINLAQSLKEVARLKVKADKAVEAIPVRVLEENPEIMIAIVAKDSVITKQGQAIDSLKASLAFQIKVKNDLMSDHYNADKINAQLQEMAQVRIVKLEKDLKKEQRRGRLLKVVAIVGSVAAFIGGSQL